MSHITSSESYSDFPTKVKKFKHKKTFFDKAKTVKLAEDGEHRARRNYKKDWESHVHDYDKYDEFYE